MEKKNITIGLDIGITSVGYSIIDEDKNIIKMGVRLFDEPSIDGGLTAAAIRRTKRGARRLIRRRQFKLKNLLEMFVAFNLVENVEQAKTIIVNGILDENGIPELPFYLKLKGLNNELSNSELIFILYHYMHHRGWFYETDEVDESIKKLNEEIKVDTTGWYPCQYQCYFYEKNKKLNGTNLNDSFSNKQYLSEIEKIFENQKHISNEFKIEYLNLFSFIRDFATGPGNQKSPTPYGLYRIEKGKITKIGDNLWTSLIGKCSIYSELKRGLKGAPLTELYNFVNELNNLHFNRDRNTKLTLNEREFILKKFNNFKDKSQWTVTPKAMVKIINQLPRFEGATITEDNICGIKFDKDGKICFTELKNLKIIVETLVKNHIIDEKEFDILNINFINRINNLFEHVSLAQNDYQRRRDLLANNQWIPLTGDSENVKLAIEELTKKLSGFSSTSSLSYKAMEEYILATYSSQEALNQMQYFSLFNHDSKSNILNKTKYFPKNFFKDEILPSTTKRAFNQTINVINKILKLYGNKYNVQNIIIEMARETNSNDEKKAIKDIQTANKKIKDKLVADYGISEKQLVGNNLLKVILWEQQNHQDIYTGETINLETLLSNVHAYHIEHVIPYSISFDNSKNNMVLTSAFNNKDKGNSTPWQWLNKKGLWSQYETRVLNCFGDKKEFKRKLENLLYKNDPSIEALGFIERNLTDTRYITKLVLENFEKFFNKNQNWVFKKNNQDCYPLIKVVNGSLTNYARYNLFIDENYRTDKALIKNRDIYNHHAVDASIIAFLGSNYNIQNRLKYISQFDKYEQVVNQEGQCEFINQETGEPLNFFKWKLQKDEVVAHFKKQLVDIINHDNQENLNPRERKIGFSRLKSTKQNGPLSKETVYSVIPNEQKTTGKIIARLDILDKDVKKLGKYFDKGTDTSEKLSLTCYQTDKKLFNQLQTIFYQYYENDKTNPFYKYMEDANKEFNTEFKDCVAIKVNDSIRKVRYLRYVTREIELENVMVLKKHINPNNNAKEQKRLAMMDGLTPFGARLYRDRKGKIVGFNINTLILKYDAKKKRLVIDQDKLNLKLDKLNIDRDAKYFELYRNQCFLDPNGVIWYSIGSVKGSMIELKSLYYSNKVIVKTSDSRKYVSINDFSNWSKIDFDLLGNIRKNMKNNI